MADGAVWSHPVSAISSLPFGGDPGLGAVRAVSAARCSPTSVGEPSVDTSNPKRPSAGVLSSFVFLDTTGTPTGNGEKQIGRAYGAPRQPSTLPGYINVHVPHGVRVLRTTSEKSIDGNRVEYDLVLKLTGKALLDRSKLIDEVKESSFHISGFPRLLIFFDMVSRFADLGYESQ